MKRRLWSWGFGLAAILVASMASSCPSDCEFVADDMHVVQHRLDNGERSEALKEYVKKLNEESEYYGCGFTLKYPEGGDSQ